MGTYIGSPWGFIRGKVGDTVGGAWKGIDWTRIRVLPTQRGTLAMYKLLKQGLITPGRFSYKQMNIRRLVLQVLGFTARTNLSNFIDPVWETLRKKRRVALTGTNLFIRRSAPALYTSIPNQNQEYNPATNCPDMSKMLVSDGDLEPVSAITVLTYDPVSGNLTFVWDHSCIKNGQGDDYLYTMVFVSPIVTSEFAPAGFLYGNAALLPPVKRMDGTTVYSIPKNLTAANVFGYVFCRDKAGEIGFSPSTGKQAS